MIDQPTPTPATTNPIERNPTMWPWSSVQACMLFRNELADQASKLAASQLDDAMAHLKEINVLKTNGVDFGRRHILHPLSRTHVLIELKHRANAQNVAYQLDQLGLTELKISAIGHSIELRLRTELGRGSKTPPLDLSHADRGNAPLVLHGYFMNKPCAVVFGKGGRGVAHDNEQHWKAHPVSNKLCFIRPQGEFIQASEDAAFEFLGDNWIDSMPKKDPAHALMERVATKNPDGDVVPKRATKSEPAIQEFPRSLTLHEAAARIRDNPAISYNSHGLMVPGIVPRHARALAQRLIQFGAQYAFGKDHQTVLIFADRHAVSVQHPDCVGWEFETVDSMAPSTYGTYRPVKPT